MAECSLKRPRTKDLLMLPTQRMSEVSQDALMLVAHILCQDLRTKET